MTNIIRPKRTATAGNVPTTTNLTAGEIAINLADTTLYVRDTNDNILALADGAIADKSTDDLSEGTTNLYYDNALVDAHITAGTGVTVNAGTIAIGQAVDTTSDVTFNDIVTDGSITANDDIVVNNNAAGNLGISDDTGELYFTRSADDDTFYAGKMSMTRGNWGESTYDPHKFTLTAFDDGVTTFNELTLAELTHSKASFLNKNLKLHDFHPFPEGSGAPTLINFGATFIESKLNRLEIRTGLDPHEDDLPSMEFQVGPAANGIAHRTVQTMDMSTTSFTNNEVDINGLVIGLPVNNRIQISSDDTLEIDGTAVDLVDSQLTSNASGFATVAKFNRSGNGGTIQVANNNTAAISNNDSAGSISFARITTDPTPTTQYMGQLQMEYDNQARHAYRFSIYPDGITNFASTSPLELNEEQVYMFDKGLQIDNNIALNEYNIQSGPTGLGRIRFGSPIAITGLTAVSNTATLPSSGTIAPDVSLGTWGQINITGDITFTGFTNPVAGQTFKLIIQHPNPALFPDPEIKTGGLGTILFKDGNKFLSTQQNGAVDVLTIFYNGTNYYVNLDNNYSVV